MRAYSAAKLGVPAQDAVASVFMDRILGVASIVILAMIGVLSARDIAGNRAVLVALAAAAGVCLVAVLLIFSAQSAAIATRLVARLPFRALRRGTDRVLASIRKYVSYPGPLVNVLTCSIAVQALRVLQAY